MQPLDMAYLSEWSRQLGDNKKFILIGRISSFMVVKVRQFSGFLQILAVWKKMYSKIH